MTLVMTNAPRRSRVGYRIVLTGLALMMAGASAPSPFYPVLQHDIGFSDAVMAGVFAIYAVALLITLLLTGSLSDHLGRRPVLSIGFVLLALSMALFWQADSTQALLIARVVQGVASGLLLSTLTATSVDLEPADRPGTAPVWNSVIPLAGLGVGALVAGAIMDHAEGARADVFGLLTLIFLALALLVWTPPETSALHEGIWRALRPRMGLPASARLPFLRAAPAVMAGWATGGLYLSLGAPIVSAAFGQSSDLAQGLVVTVLSGVGALACYVMRKRNARQVTLFGTAALALGTVLTLVALHLGSFPLYLVTVAIAGAGFGTCFYGVMRSVTPVVALHERSELFATLFTLSYLSFGLPVVIAGLALPYAGLMPTITAYGAVIVVFSATAGLMRWLGTKD